MMYSADVSCQQHFLVFFKGLIVSFSLYLFCIPYTGQSQSLNNLNFGTDTTFDIATWNIERFPKVGSLTSDSVSSIIDRLNMDIWALQEIEDTTATRLMLTQLPEYDVYFGPGWFDGLAFLYHKNSIQINAIYKIFDSSIYWDYFPRAPIVMECTFQGSSFVLINNHLKCCGDGVLLQGDNNDEENRRYVAVSFLKQYVETNFANQSVIMLGDWNDRLNDAAPNNVFQPLLDDSLQYRFADEVIAYGPFWNWSFPGYPSHLDHIVVNQPLFAALQGAHVQTIRIDDYLVGGWNYYDTYISDHRPLAMRFMVPTTSVEYFNKLPVQSLHVYPIPFDQFLTLDLSFLTSSASIQILDALGRKVNYFGCDEPKKLQIEIKGPAGSYFVLLQTGKSIYTKAVVKQ